MSRTTILAVAVLAVGAMLVGAGAANASTIRQIGSTTVLPLAQEWRVAFNKLHPSVDIAVSGGGSGAGIKALIAKACEIANASREIKSEEVAQARANGVSPVAHTVAYDGIVVIVHPGNPCKQLSVKQLSDIFSGAVTNWSQVGVRNLGRIQLVNRDSSSGTYASFEEMVVQMDGKAKDRKFSPRALSLASNAAVVSTVAKTTSAIGYCGLAYDGKTVKGLSVVPLSGGAGVVPTNTTVRSGKYPISRKLYCYTNGQPTGNLKLYLDFMKSDAGQKIVDSVGFVPIR